MHLRSTTHVFFTAIRAVQNVLDRPAHYTPLARVQEPERGLVRSRPNFLSVNTFRPLLCLVCHCTNVIRTLQTATVFSAGDLPSRRGVLARQLPQMSTPHKHALPNVAVLFPALYQRTTRAMTIAKQTSHLSSLLESFTRPHIIPATVGF